MIETATTAAIGATVSILDVSGSVGKLARMWFVGFFMALFVADDAIKFIQHLLNFEISKGGTVFMIALLGAAIVERVLFFIKSFKLSTIGYKK